MDLFSLCAGFWTTIGESFVSLWESTGVNSLFTGYANWQNLVMILISCILVYLAIVKKYEPLLLLPIAFGAFIINIPGAHDVLYAEPTESSIGGLFHYIYILKFQ